jgi:hypothetical protein
MASDGDESVKFVLEHGTLTSTKIRKPGIEPGTYCVLGSRHNQLDHSRTDIHGGTRTPNLVIRSHTPYPLGHADILVLLVIL